MLSTILSFIASHSPLLPPIFCISTALEILSNCAYPKSSVILPSPLLPLPTPLSHSRHSFTDPLHDRQSTCSSHIPLWPTLY